MNPEPMFKLYSDVHYIVERPEIAAIQGQRLGIIARSLDEEGHWSYLVSVNKHSEPIACYESELESAEPIQLSTDSEHRENIVAQTAQLWHSVKWAGVRQLLSHDGYNPHQCLLLSCEQGLDVEITLVLPDGTIASADYREDHQTRQATRWEEWRTLEYSDREIEQCHEIQASDLSEFEAEVLHYFNKHLKATDHHLPPIN